MWGGGFRIDVSCWFYFDNFECFDDFVVDLDVGFGWGLCVE